MKKQVIIIEDDPDIRELIEHILASENYQVLAFNRIRDFKSGLPRCRPDIILLDIMLPDGNGIDLCKELKTDADTRHIPIVLMSANYTKLPGDCNADEFIPKPFDIGDLIAHVRQKIS